MISIETYAPSNNKHMVQYGVWPDCTNCCDFCLRLERKPCTKKEKLYWLDKIKKNIELVDWKGKYSKGISLLGGELYYIRDIEIQQSFLELIDIIIEKILIPCGKDCKYSTVTNGIYKPDFLYKVIDRIISKTSIDHIDINFSYDLKYRYKTEKARLLAYNNINDFHKRYNYKVGVQMILTQYLIDMWKAGQFDTKKFMDENFPGNNLAFLYPHPIHTKKKDLLTDFYFKRLDFLEFMKYLKVHDPIVFFNFINSTKNSSTFKYTGLPDKKRMCDGENAEFQQPKLSDGKEEINDQCGHSILYKCYADSNKCVLCDLEMMDSEL